MSDSKNLITERFLFSSLVKRMLIGSAMALTLISVFLYGVDNPKPEWHRLWMLRPLIIVPLAGATGGAFFYFLSNLLYTHGWRKVLATILAVLIFIIGLWMGFVLGLDGTLWD